MTIAARRPNGGNPASFAHGDLGFVKCLAVARHKSLHHGMIREVGLDQSATPARRSGPRDPSPDAEAENVRFARARVGGREAKIAVHDAHEK